MKILVYGWYHQSNLGDDLFIEAFRSLFPHYEFEFTNQIARHNLSKCDAVFIGGGSFLGEPLNIQDDGSYKLLKQKKIFYIGVGLETEVNSLHYELMQSAQLLAIRNSQFLDKALAINPNSIVIPDLVYYLQPSYAMGKINKSVLFIPNISVVPPWNEKYWKHAAWNYFKAEVSQFLDGLVEEGITLRFLPLCTNHLLDDRAAAVEITNSMINRSHEYLLPQEKTLESATKTISRYNVIVTQRYHGIVLAEMVNVPCLSIYHHDKLKNSQNASLPFYGITKDKLREQFNHLFHAKVSSILPIDRDMFITLQRRVENALCAG